MREGISIGGNVSIQISGPCAPADGSVTAAKINSGNAGDGQVLTADGSGGAAWEAAAGGGPGYLEYVALLSQSATNAPVATVHINTLGGEVVWVRDGVGNYTGSHAIPFQKTKTVVFLQNVKMGYDPIYSIATAVLDNHTINIQAVNASAQQFEDGILDCSSIEIRVYP